LYEFVCNHIIPGCTYKEQGDTLEAVREKALAHLNEHHDMSYIDQSMQERINAFAIRALRP
jgi:predicted small metal-binding protein